jgi:hypothetical protein
VKPATLVGGGIGVVGIGRGAAGEGTEEGG